MELIIYSIILAVLIISIIISRILYIRSQIKKNLIVIIHLHPDMAEKLTRLATSRQMTAEEIAELAIRLFIRQD